MSGHSINRNWARIFAVSLLVMALTGGVWLFAPTGGSGAVEASSSLGCGAAYDQPIEGFGGDDLGWAISPEASDAFTRLHELIDGSSSLLDLRVHYSERVVLVVVDPGSTVPAAVAERIRGSVAAIGADVQFVAGCASRDDLERASESAGTAMAEVIPAEDLTRFGGVAVSIDLAAGRVRLEADPQIGGKILAAMDSGTDLVDLVEGAPEVLSRTVDSPPFAGGASFTTYDSGTPVGLCTSGFGSRFDAFGSYDVMATAAHCGEGGAVPMGAYNSGWQVGLFMVDGAFAAYVYPGPQSTYGRDVAILRNPDVTYSNRLYSDPGVSPRYVTNFGDAFAGTPVCTNGSVTLSSCYSLPADYNSYICANVPVWGAVKCMWVVRFTLYGGQMIAPGDSGGTVYQPWGGTGARASGVVTGRNLSSGSIYITPVSFFITDSVTPKT